eukprot:gene21811-21238_t
MIFSAVLMTVLGTEATAVSDDAIEFNAFVQQYSKAYRDADELALRRAIFTANLKTINSLSSPSALYGVGPFADLTPAEFMVQYTSVSPPRDQALSAYSDSRYLGEHIVTAVHASSLPKDLDWVAKGAVTAVKKQRCGNCWTFSAAGSIEGAYAIKTKKLTNFSEQEFVDCIDTGCSGGWNFNALKFAVNHTVCTLEDFPCTGKGNGSICEVWESSPCSTMKGALMKGSLSGWKSVGAKAWGKTTETELASALQQGPVSINMFADAHMGHYKGGVLSYANCSAGTNHGVLAVGYGTCKPGAATGPCANVTKTVEYWKVKNSWGADFGVDGYFYLEKGKYAAGCGPAGILLTNPSYPVMV